MTSDMEAQAGPVQVRGTVLTVRRVDAYYAMTLVAPAVAARLPRPRASRRRAKGWISTPARAVSAVTAALSAMPLAACPAPVTLGSSAKATAGAK